MRDLIGLLAVLLLTGGMVLYRLLGVEPLAWGSLCISADPPWACTPRGWLTWLQHWQLWGAAAMALALVGFLLPGRRLPFVLGVAAVAAGAIAIVNYNATWGGLAAVLGAWRWLEARAEEEAA